MSLIYNLAEDGRKKEKKKLAKKLLESGVEQKKIKEVTGLSKAKIKQLKLNQKD